MTLTHRIQINTVQAGVITSFGHCHWAVNIVVVIIANAIGKSFSTMGTITTVMVVVGCVVIIVVHIVRIDRTAGCDVR